MDLMVSGNFDMTKLISATIPLDEANDMFKTLTSGPNDLIKVIVTGDTKQRRPFPDCVLK